jgi:hypothetical protein
MAPANLTERDGTNPNPPTLGSFAYLMLNFPLGLASFVFLVTTLSVGLSTAIIWVGVPVLAISLLAVRGAARLERRRVHTMLGTYIATPYRPLPEGTSGRWKTRVKDIATWKDLGYFVLMGPIGVAEFVLMVTFWSASLWLLLLPLWFGLVPQDWYPEVWGWVLGHVDSTWEALPWAAVGAVLLAVTILMTRVLGMLHARFARAMLGPNPRRLDALEETPTVDWDFRTHVYPGVTS